MVKSKSITVYSELLPEGISSPYKSDETRLEQRSSPYRKISMEVIKNYITNFSEIITEIIRLYQRMIMDFQ
jgi:hypothetical protein